MRTLLPVNWGFIEPLFRAGGLSNYEIARQYERTHARSKDYKPSVTEAAIRDMARRRGWDKDLGERVKQRTEAKVLRSELRKCEVSAPSGKLTEEEIVEAAAEGRAKVVESIRGLIDKALGVAQDLIERYRADCDQVQIGWYRGKAFEHRVKLGDLERARMGKEISVMVANLAPHLRLAWGLDDKTRGNEGKTVEVNLNMAGQAPDEEEQHAA